MQALPCALTCASAPVDTAAPITRPPLVLGGRDGAAAFPRAYAPRATAFAATAGGRLAECECGISTDGRAGSGAGVDDWLFHFCGGGGGGGGGGAVEVADFSCWAGSEPTRARGMRRR